MTRFVLGQHFGERLVDAELPGDGFSRALRITGQHYNAHARALERRYRFVRAFLDRVGHRSDASSNTVHSEEHHRLGFRTPGFCARFPPPRVYASLCEKAAAA